MVRMSILHVEDTGSIPVGAIYCLFTLEFFFKLFTIFCALMVINAKNPVYSIIFLIVVFTNSAGLLLFLGAEFLGMIFLVVYIGAIAVLFLFVVMMINIRYMELTTKELFYLPLNGFFLIIPLSIQISLYLYGTISDLYTLLPSVSYANLLFSSSNMEVLGFLVYSPRYFWIVFFSALILLVAMIGSIALTLVKRFDVKRQDIFYQLSRPVQNSVRIVTNSQNL